MCVRKREIKLKRGIMREKEKVLRGIGKTECHGLHRQETNWETNGGGRKAAGGRERELGRGTGIN